MRLRRLLGVLRILMRNVHRKVLRKLVPHFPQQGVAILQQHLAPAFREHILSEQAVSATNPGVCAFKTVFLPLFSTARPINRGSPPVRNALLQK